ncbi:molybdopterin converting factor subunit 1 [Nibricoccus sp. IMCC34717]|uniref:molybdopterin converting factor subunit 1 n=1 Tax=Nibricoccus sp. IMCC34717 TaxID=3034021 RepID=UPI00384A980B
MPRVRLRYFALLRDQAGRAEETLDTASTNGAALYAELASRHGFTLAAHQVRVALNGEFAAMNSPLREGDEVVFIPPVAGG